MFLKLLLYANKSLCYISCAGDGITIIDHWFFDHIRELEQAYFLLNKRFTRYRQNEVDTLVNQTKEELRDNTVLELDNELDQAIDFLIDQVGYYDYRQEVFQNYPEGYNSDSTEAP